MSNQFWFEFLQMFKIESKAFDELKPIDKHEKLTSFQYGKLYLSVSVSLSLSLSLYYFTLILYFLRPINFQFLISFLFRFLNSRFSLYSPSKDWSFRTCSLKVAITDRWVKRRKMSLKQNRKVNEKTKNWNRPSELS